MFLWSGARSWERNKFFVTLPHSLLLTLIRLRIHCCSFVAREKKRRPKTSRRSAVLPSTPAVMMMLIVWTFPNFSSFESLISTAAATDVVLDSKICQEVRTHRARREGKEKKEEKKTTGEKYNFSAPFFFTTFLFALGQLKLLFAFLPFSLVMQTQNSYFSSVRSIYSFFCCFSGTKCAKVVGRLIFHFDISIPSPRHLLVGRRYSYIFATFNI